MEVKVVHFEREALVPFPAALADSLTRGRQAVTMAGTFVPAICLAEIPETAVPCGSIPAEFADGLGVSRVTY
jgi:hypothetical protein